MVILGDHPVWAIIQFCVVVALSWLVGYNWQTERWFRKTGVGVLFLLIILVTMALWGWLRFNFTIAAIEIIAGIAMLLRGDSQAYYDQIKHWSELVPNHEVQKRR